MSMRARWRVEAVTAALFAVITVVTVLWPDWIEGLTTLEPDAGSGSAEWVGAGLGRRGRGGHDAGTARLPPVAARTAGTAPASS